MQKLSGLFLFVVLISGIFSSSSAFAQIPTAVDDSYSVDEDSLLTVFPNGVLFNDSDVGDDFFSIILTNTGFGILALNQNGTFTYQPNENFSSTDSFTYALNNGTHNSNNATVTITVNPINDAPVAQDDLAETQQNVPIRIHVLENDSDVEDDSLNIILEVDPLVTKGNVTLDSSDVLFTPQTDFVGETSFSYRVSDGDKTSNLANVTITINSINDIPDAVDDTATTPENTSVIIPVLTNDTDADDDLLTIISVTQPFSGAVVIVSSSTQVEYTPNTDFVGNDTFTYVISDSQGGSDSAIVSVEVKPNNVTIIEQLLAQVQSLLDKILNLENEITTLQEENTALVLRNAELEDIIANGTPTDDDDDSDNKVIVCHKNKKSLTISENALPAHLKHGDIVGECDDVDISPKNEFKTQIKELKNDYKVAQKELKKEFKSQEKDLKKQFKDLKKEKKSKDKDDHDDDD